MADRVFMDASFALALLNPQDQLHQVALGEVAVVRNALRVVTTTAVLIEICDAMGNPAVRTQAGRFIESSIRQATGKCDREVSARIVGSRAYPRAM